MVMMILQACLVLISPSIPWMSLRYLAWLLSEVKMAEEKFARTILSS